MDPVQKIIIAVIYLGIGAACMLWIKRDSEFRNMGTADLLGYGSIVLWPIFTPLYYFMRPDEALKDLAAKGSYTDFRNFMKSRKASDSDFGKSIDKYRKTSPDSPLELMTEEQQYKDLHLEELINNSEWQEAMRTANDMLRFAREQQEYTRVKAYEQYINDIKEKRLRELD